MTALEQRLQLLREQNRARNFDGPLTQRVRPPQPLQAIATLDGQHREPTPMLAQRFRFAGSWHNAVAGQHWLSLAQIAAFSRKRAVREQIALRQTHWPTSLLAKTDPGSVSLFSIDRIEMQEVYLIWKTTGEPRIAAYLNWNENVFPNLGGYLRYLTAGE